MEGITFSFGAVRDLLAARNEPLADNELPGGIDTVDDLLDILTADFHALYPKAPDGVGWAFAVAWVEMALKLGGRPGGDDNDDGGRGPRHPAPEPEPEALLA